MTFRSETGTSGSVSSASVPRIDGETFAKLCGGNSRI